MQHKIAVIGGGAWGSALAAQIARARGACLLWAREQDVVAAINQQRENRFFLAGVRLPDGLEAVNELAALAAAEIVFFACPAQVMRAMAEKAAPFIAADALLVSCAKGLESGSAALMSEVLAEVLPRRQLAVLSGPSFAGEIARGLPASLILACSDKPRAVALAEEISSARFRLYWSDDVVGAQLGGAAKNVLAIACGIAQGRQLGENARAALITRGFAEIARLGLAAGAKAGTLAGLAGLGDLILTCSSAESRNMSLGIELGRGGKLEEILARRRTVSEGAHSAAPLLLLAARYQTAMPITESVDAILRGQADIGEAISALLARPAGEEKVFG